MVTGDNLQTAKAIALECGILGSESDVTEHTIIEGKVFREFSEKEREQVAKEIKVCLQNVLDTIPEFLGIQDKSTINICIGNGKVFSE